MIRCVEKRFNLNRYIVTYLVNKAMFLERIHVHRYMNAQMSYLAAEWCLKGGHVRMNVKHGRPNLGRLTFFEVTSRLQASATEWTSSCLRVTSFFQQHEEYGWYLLFDIRSSYDNYSLSVLSHQQWGNSIRCFWKIIVSCGYCNTHHVSSFTSPWSSCLYL